ncbi:MAG: alpha-L-fucosidase [Lachnospiraceae bacterium]
MEKYLETIEEVIAKGKYKDTWESLQQYRVPDWYGDVKFGIFIHWGIFSVPAFANEWYSRNMYIQGSPEYEHHIKTYGHRRISDIRILFQCSKQRTSTQRNGLPYLRKLVHSMSCL